MEKSALYSELWENINDNCFFLQLRNKPSFLRLYQNAKHRQMLLSLLKIKCCNLLNSSSTLINSSSLLRTDIVPLFGPGSSESYFTEFFSTVGVNIGSATMIWHLHHTMQELPQNETTNNSFQHWDICCSMEISARWQFCVPMTWKFCLFHLVTLNDMVIVSLCSSHISNNPKSAEVVASLPPFSNSDLW